MSIIYLNRPSRWPRIAFGVAVAAVLCMVAGLALAGESAAGHAKPSAAPIAVGGEHVRAV
jgi:hypothetical protein